jgi:hypothetical protein
MPNPDSGCSEETDRANRQTANSQSNNPNLDTQRTAHNAEERCPEQNWDADHKQHAGKPVEQARWQARPVRQIQNWDGSGGKFHLAALRLRDEMGSAQYVKNSSARPIFQREHPPAGL